MEQLVEKVKYHSLWWLKTNKTNFMYGTQRWWSNPLLCLGIDWPSHWLYIVWRTIYRGDILVHLVLRCLTTVVNIFHFYVFKKNDTS